MDSTLRTPKHRGRAVAINRWLYWFTQNWMLLFSLGFGLYVGLPFLAPVFMKIGWSSIGKVIYFIFSFLCHQLPQRSLFLFGPDWMPSLGEIQAVWKNTNDPFLLRQFIGNSEIGWKMAWSDRMVSMYTSILFFAWIWYPIRKKLKPLPLWGLILLLVPMGIDGSTHFVSDLAGIGEGFRYSNHWLISLTNNTFSPNFYGGDAIGSFNSWMRWISGILFGLGVVGFGFPYLEGYYQDIASTIKNRFDRANFSL